MTWPAQPAEPANDRDTVLPPSLAQVLLRWARNTAIAALAVSMVLHVGGLALSRFVAVGSGGGGGGAGDRPASDAVEMAVITQAELAEVENAAMSLDTPAVPDMVPQVQPEIPGAMDAGPGDDGAGAGSEIGDVGPLAGGGDISDGGGLGLGGSGGGGTSFFGVEAQGNRFAYIVDVSGSMAGPKLERLKAELIKSLDGLLETSEFLIVQYASGGDETIIGTVKGWQQASDAAKRSIRAEITLLETRGSTFPYPAFELLAKTPPRPDVVYFLTDGDFDGNPDQVADDILKLVTPWRVPVHTICFDTEASQGRMRRIARQTRGTFTFLRGDAP